MAIVEASTSMVARAGAPGNLAGAMLGAVGATLASHAGAWMRNAQRAWLTGGDEQQRHHDRAMKHGGLLRQPNASSSAAIGQSERHATSTSHTATVGAGFPSSSGTTTER